MIKLGCFVETNMFNGQWYGLSIDSIESVAAEGLATVVNMELEVSYVEIDLVVEVTLCQNGVDQISCCTSTCMHL